MPLPARILDMNEDKARQWMQAHVAESEDPLTGEVCCTNLAESCCIHFDACEALEDPDHWVWELAIEVGVKE